MYVHVCSMHVVHVHGTVYSNSFYRGHICNLVRFKCTLGGGGVSSHTRALYVIDHITVPEVSTFIASLYIYLWLYHA